jgi:hypothetical protein
MKKKKGLMLYLISFTALLIIPVLIILTVFHLLLTSDRFYTGIIKQMNPVEKIIEAKNLEIENDVKREIEKRTGIKSFMPEYEKIRKEYQDKELEFHRLYKTAEYSRIKNQIKKLKDLEWIKSSDEFKDEDDFHLFKKNKLAELKRELEEIEKFRKSEKEQINQLEKELDFAEGNLKKADRDLKDRKEEAEEILESRQSEFMNTMYADIHKISPVLTEQLNTLLIDREIKNIINIYLDFLMTHNIQKQQGNIFVQRFDIESGMIENRKIVKLPPLKLSLRVNVDEGGVSRERHLLSEVFVKNIGSIQGLENPWVITKIFSMSDSWLIEKYARSKLKDAGMTIENGIIKSSGPIIIKGKAAEITEYAMLFFTYGKYLKYITPGIILFFIFAIFIAAPDKKTGAGFAGIVLKYPAYIIIIISASAVVISFKPSFILTGFGTDPVTDTIMESLFSAAAVHIFIPLIICFTVIMLTGIILCKLGRKGES